MQVGRYRLLELKKRAVPGSALPSWRLLPMRRTPQRDGLNEVAISAIGARSRAASRRWCSSIGVAIHRHWPAMSAAVASCRHCSARLVLHPGAALALPPLRL